MVSGSFAVAMMATAFSKFMTLSQVEQPCIRKNSMGRNEFTPGCESGQGRLKINEFGIRAEVPSAPGTSSIYPILYLGWSEPHGAALSDSELLPSVLQDRLNTTSGSKKRFQVINAAGPGVGSQMEIQQLELLIRTYRPRALIYLFVPRSEDIQYAAQVHFGDTSGSIFDNQRALIQLGWKARYARDPVATIIEPTLLTIKKMFETAQRENIRVIMVWPGLGLPSGAWNLAAPQKIEGFILRFLELFRISFGVSAGGIRRLLVEQKIEFSEVSSLGPIFARRMVWSPNIKRDRTEPIADQLLERLLREFIEDGAS